MSTTRACTRTKISSFRIFEGSFGKDFLISLNPGLLGINSNIGGRNKSGGGFFEIFACDYQLKGFDNA